MMVGRNVGRLGRILIVVLGFAVAAPLHGFLQPANAQTTAAQSLSFSSISVRGNQRIETATIVNFVNIKRGEAVSPGRINAAYQNLLRTGLFEEVSVVPSGATLIVTVREFPTINVVAFEGNKRLKDEDLSAVVTSLPRRTYSPSQAEADAELIAEAYRQSGRFSAKVTPKIIRRADNRVDLVFEIKEGRVVEINRLSFVGNRTYSDRRLRRVLSTKQAGLLRAFTKNDVFIADRLSFDKQVLSDFYLSRGFIDFQILSVSSEKARQRNGFFVTFHVREGQSYDFGDVTTETTRDDIDVEEFQKLVRLRHGDTYSPNRVEKTIELMEQLATRKGLNFIRVTPRVVRNDADRTLDLTFVIEKGPRLFVERIDIEGNETTIDRVVRRQFDTVEGDPFNPRAIAAAARRIEGLGFFSATEVQPRTGSTDDSVIVDVNLEEQPTGSLSFGVTYSGTDGAGGTVALTESNFLGRGQFVEAKFGLGSVTQDISLKFVEPAFLDRKVRLELALTQLQTTQQNAQYNTVDTAFRIGFGFKSSENSDLSVYYQRAADTISGVTAASSTLITNSTQQTGVLGLNYIYDTRGAGTNINAGTVFRINQEIAGLGGAANFSRTTVLAGAQVTSRNEELSFSVEFEGGLLSDFSGTSSMQDRFFLGDGIMRGFATRGIGPRDLTAANNDALGGNMYSVVRLEANFPLGFGRDNGISGGLFMDVGSLWGLDNNLGGAIDSSFIPRTVIGASLFWESPLGPLRFNFTQAVNKQSYDQTQDFSITFGRRF